MTTTRRTWLLVGGGMLLAVVVVLAVRLNRPAYRSPVIGELGRATQVRGALGAYAQEHDGKFPKTLSELLPEYSDFFPPTARQFHDPVTKQTTDWIYYGGYARVTDNTNDLPKGDIILASPVVVWEHERIVIYADTTGAIIEENEFALRISRQLNERAQQVFPK